MTSIARNGIICSRAVSLRTFLPKYRWLKQSCSNTREARWSETSIFYVRDLQFFIVTPKVGEEGLLRVDAKELTDWASPGKTDTLEWGQ